MDVDWKTWTPTVRATLLFVERGDELLLIRKKTGLGAGKINAPGGKIEPGETPEQGAVREVLEEVGVRAHGVRRVGELSFQFVDGLRLHAVVFVASGHTGEPHSTREADPLWVRRDAIPYDEMWADDRYWVPHLLAGEGFHLRAVFDDDEMLSHTLEVWPLGD